MDADDFDDSETAPAPSAAQANEELRRIAATRAHEHFDRAEKRAQHLRHELESAARNISELAARMVLMMSELDNWIGLLRELKSKEQ